MQATAIIPCHPRNLPTLKAALESVRSAARRWRELSPGAEVEEVVVEDPEGRGLSWARNRGLERAHGDYVFFVDADDTVEPDFFAHPIAALERERADLCLFQYALSPLKRDYDLVGNAAVRAALLPAFAGYSFADVRRWAAGGRLDERREPGSVCRVAFRREFLVRHALGFDERLAIYEDAPFMAECALLAERVISLGENLYDYRPGPEGITARVTCTRRWRDYKFAVLDRRLALEAKYGGFWEYCSASPVLSALQLWRHPLDFVRFVRRAEVRRAFREFPWSMSLIWSAVRR